MPEFGKFEIRNKEVEKLLQEIGTRLNHATSGSDYGFALLVFSFKGPDMFYCSNAERESMIAAFQEFIAKHRIN